MKKLLIGGLALGTFSSFAKDLKCEIIVIKNNELVRTEGAKIIKMGETYHYKGEKLAYEVRRNGKNTIMILHDLEKELTNYSSFQANVSGSASLIDHQLKENTMLGCK